MAPDVIIPYSRRIRAIAALMAGSQSHREAMARAEALHAECLADRWGFGRGHGLTVFSSEVAPRPFAVFAGREPSAEERLSLRWAALLGAGILHFYFRPVIDLVLSHAASAAGGDVDFWQAGFSGRLPLPPEPDGSFRQRVTMYVLRPGLRVGGLPRSPTAEQLLSVGVDIWAMPGVPSLRVAGYVGLGLVDPVPALPEARIPCPELVLSR